MLTADEHTPPCPFGRLRVPGQSMDRHPSHGGSSTARIRGPRSRGAYKSDDALTWTRQPASLLATFGTGKDDQNGGHHPEVILSGERAQKINRDAPDATFTTTHAVPAALTRGKSEIVLRVRAPAAGRTGQLFSIRALRAGG